MKRILFGVITIALLTACSQTNGETTTAQSEPATETAAAGDTAAPTAAANDPAATGTAPAQEASMSDYENKVAELHTTAGEIDIRFYPDVAPNHVKNFIDLAKKGFYDGTKFHRVIPGFMIQGGDPNTKTGDPNTWGTGGADSYVKAEFNAVPHKRGIVSMARAQSPDSASSQFFIVVADSRFLDRQYSVFGQVTKGMDIADKIVAAPRDRSNDRPSEPTTITKVVIRDANDGEKGPAPK